MVGGFRWLGPHAAPPPDVPGWRPPQRADAPAVVDA